MFVYTLDIFYLNFLLKKYWLSRFGASNRKRADLELNPWLIGEDPASDDAECSLVAGKCVKKIQRILTSAQRETNLINKMK